MFYNNDMTDDKRLRLVNVWGAAAARGARRRGGAAAARGGMALTEAMIHERGYCPRDPQRTRRRPSPQAASAKPILKPNKYLTTFTNIYEISNTNLTGLLTLDCFNLGTFFLWTNIVINNYYTYLMM